MQKLLLSFSLLLSFGIAAAQQTYTIKLSDAKTGAAITDASVVLYGTTKGAAVVGDGIYTIVAKAGDRVEITSVGYAPEIIKLGSNTNVSVNLNAQMLDLGDVVIVGTRGAPRAKTETAVPIDVIKINQVGAPTARMDLTSILNMAAPSFNYNKQTGSDGADHIDLGTLRGLGPDQTLVLINGKRRHQTAFVGLFGTRGRGNSGADLNAFPQSSVDRIEILRDGASAQYGSDAMAGVMNIILKKDVNHWTVNAGWAGFYDTKYNAYKTRATNQYISSKPIDGGTFSLSANNGLTLGKNGFVNFSIDYLTQAKTFRQVPDTNVSSNKDALPLNTSRRAFGDGSVKTFGFMSNMELPIAGTKTVFYSFGGVNTKESDAYAYSRNLSARPDRFPIDASGDPIFVEGIMHRANDGEVYYNPHIGTEINDASLALGFKGVSVKNWNWDISLTNGKNDFQYSGSGTFNASMIGNTTQTRFADGGFRFRQATLNVDMSKNFKSIAEGLNFAYGLEYRHEKYTINKGEEASYLSYDPDLEQAGGAQGFPGFSPNDVIKATRYSMGAYADAELNVSKAFLVDGALRWEYYQDFGAVLNFKIASRLKVTNNFNLRGSASTGFRAPSLQQINFSNTLTSFSAGQLVQSRIASNGDAVTQAAGIPALKEETSLNSSLGFAWKPMSNLTVTIDGYMVKVKDRIVLSGLFDKDDASLPTSFTNQLAALDVQTAQFFANSVNTTNFGVDIVLDYSKKWGNKTFKGLLTGNFQKMKVDGVNIPAALNDSYRHRKTFFSDREEAFLLASAPQAKAMLGLQYGMDKFSVGTHINYYGNIKTLGFGWTGLASAAGTGGPGDPEISGSFTGIDPYVDIDGYSDQVHVEREIFNYTGKITTDIFVSYKLNKVITIFAGADNVLNVHPEFAAVKNARYEAFDNETGGPWESVQMGFNGRRIFTKLAFNF
ncbi:MAG: TonB-dependent receptor [Ferruginibacter sp.]